MTTPLRPHVVSLFAAVLAASLGVVTACGNEAAEETTETEMGSGSSAPATTGPGSTATTDSAGVSDDGAPAHPCGNGQLDQGEECDNGSENSDETPDACREHCREHRCGDGVLDSDEVCDDGDANGNVADTCRVVTCQLPSCGDGVADTGEACDDGNTEWGDGCYQCSRRHYFLLLGDGSVLRNNRNGESTALIGPTADMIRIAFPADLSVLLGLRSSGAPALVGFDPAGGEELWTLPLEANTTASALATLGQVAYVTLDRAGTTELWSVPLDRTPPALVADLGGAISIGDMVSNGEDALYITTRAGNSVLRVLPETATVETFGDGGDGLVMPVGVTYDVDTDVLWVANNPAGASATMMRADATGAFTADSVMGATTDPNVVALAIDVGDLVLAAMQNEDRIVAVENFDSVNDFFTDMVTAPADIEAVELTR